MNRLTLVASFLAAISLSSVEGSLRSLRGNQEYRHKAAREAVCKVANDYCKAIVGEHSHCQAKGNGLAFCHGSDFQCDCDVTEQAEETTTTTSVAPQETVTSPVPTATSASTTPKRSLLTSTRRTQEVTAKASTTASPNTTGECEDMPEGEVPAALWIENTTGLSTSRANIEKYYRQVIAYVNGNCARLSTKKVIVRVYHPEFPSKEGSYYAPSTTSALFTELLSKLPSDVQVHFYPYVMDAHDQEKWAAYGGSDDVMANVYKFTADWNKVLASAGKTAVKGVVIDNEEVRGWSNHAQIFSESNINKLKGGLEFAFTIGFDETPKIEQWSSFVNHFYLQAYDFYAPTPNISQTSKSMFLKVQDDADQLADYVDGSAIADRQWTAYAQHTDRVTLMWSTQEINGDGCLYPLNDGTCGQNHEFGSWTPRAFNEFLKTLREQNPTAAAVEHAIFQFALMPKSWMPKSARN